MALNIYTAVANPITIEGRIKIAQGALAHKDLRTRVKDLLQPFICVLTDKSALVNARIHSDAILTARQGEERSLKECLKSKALPTPALTGPPLTRYSLLFIGFVFCRGWPRVLHLVPRRA